MKNIDTAKAAIRRGAALIVTLPVAFGLGGCSTARPPLACSALKTVPDLQISLMFGLSRPDGTMISDGEWQNFVSTVVTPRFADGLTISNGSGQWRDRVSGRITSEPSRIIWIATQASPDLNERIDAIRASYRMQFHQQSVGLTIISGCESF